ncbi:MAG: hypothetical protein FWE77_00385, partial [Clostridia bacterium]|nr:hypothetical protein [Clostridia bacterium]
MKKRAVNKKRARIRLQRVCWTLALSAVGAVVIYPLLFVLMTSFKSNIDFMVNPLGIPTSLHPSNYATAWELGRVGQYFFNSVIVAVFTLALQIVMISLASYALGKLKPWGHGLI